MTDGVGGARIVFVNFGRQCWGAEESMLTLASQLDRDRIALVCVNPTLRERWATRIGAPVTLVRAGRNRAGDALAAARLASGFTPTDTVVLFSYHLLPGLVLARQLGRTRARVVLDLHDHIAGRRGRALMQRFGRRADLVIAPSRFVLDGLDLPRTSAIHRPVLPLAPTPSTAGLTAAVVGRIAPEKRIDVAIDATAAVPDLRLVVRGAADPVDTTFAAALHTYAASRLGARVSWDGRVAADAVLDRVDVLVVGNPHEPMGRTVCEAQRAGLPVVVPDTGGSAELVTDGVTGLHYRAGDPADLADRLRVLAAEPALRRRLGTAAKAYGELAYDPARYAARYAAAIGVPDAAPAVEAAGGRLAAAVA